MEELVDPECVPLPFLVFVDGRLRTANAGGRTLLGLDTVTSSNSTSLDKYSYEDLFPVSVEGSNRTLKDRHLQTLRVKVQSSREVLRCKAAVYTGEGRDRAVCSVLIVDVEPVESDASGEQPRGEDRPSNNGSNNVITNAAAASSSSSSSAPSVPSNSSIPTTAVPSSPTRPSLPSAIKRHSGDIRKIFSNTIERKRSQHHEKQHERQRSIDAAASRQAPSVPPPAASSAMNVSMSSTESGNNTTSSSQLHKKRGSVPTLPPMSSSVVPTSPPKPPSFTTHNSNSDKSFSSASIHSKTSTSGYNTSIAPSMGRGGSTTGIGSAERERGERGHFQSLADTADFSLAQAALAAHPRTGVIISKADLSSGFINSRTRELLMGIKSPEHEWGENTMDDMWYSASASRERQHAASSVAEGGEGEGEGEGGSYMPSMTDMDGQQEELEEQRGEDGDGDGSTAKGDNEDSPTWEDEIIFEDGKIRIDKPDRGENLQTSISDILRWSLRRRRVRQHHRLLRDDITSAQSMRSGKSGTGSPAVSVLSGSSGTTGTAGGAGGVNGVNGPRTSMPMSSKEAYSIIAAMEEEDRHRPWIARKPYKVYDSSFSQRVEDPFESLFDFAVRKGSIALNQIDQSVIVGIETEVGPPGPQCGFPENECFTYLSEGTDASPNRVQTRVRRRVVQARAAPLRDMNGEHLGGVVWLRDITGETGPPSTVPHLLPDQPTDPLSLLPQNTVEGSTSPSTLTTAPPPRLTGTVSDSSQATLSSLRASASASVSSITPGFQGPIGHDGATFWQIIINSMPHMVWVTKPDGSHIYFNNKWYQYTGLQPEQSLGVNWQNPFHPDDMPNSRKSWSRSLATGEPYSVEYRCRRHDGIWRWHLGRAQALFDANGKIVAWFGTCTDVEVFVDLRTKLAEMARNLRRVIDLGRVTLLCVDRELKVLFMEGGGSTRKKLSPEGEAAMTGTPLADIYPDPTLSQRANEVLNGLESARTEFQIRPEVWIGCHLTPLREQAGQQPHGVVIVTTDITDLKEAEKALKKSYEEQSRLLASETAAKEASRLKSEFTANLSHEIRTPITGMIGMSELLLEEEMTPAQHESVRKILKSGEILLKMVGDVLDIGKVEAGKLELDTAPFILTDLMTDATVMFRTAASKKGLKFIEDTSNLYQGEVMGDLPRMRQVLLNFLANSVKFTKKGHITLRVRQDEETPTSIRVRFVVEDSGIGIAKDVIPILFHAFQQADSTTSKEHGGTGLGLVISKRLVEMMNGTVTLESDFGVGTRITVIVPFQKSSRPVSDLLRRPSRPSSRGSGASSPSLTAATTSPSAHEEGVSNPLASAQLQQKLLREQGQEQGEGMAMAGTAKPLVSPSANMRSLPSASSLTDAASSTHTSKANHSPHGPSAPLPAEIDRSSIWILLAEDNALNAEIFTRGITRMGFNVKAVTNGQEFLDALPERTWDLALLDCHMPVMDGYEAVGALRKSGERRIREMTVIALTASAIAGDREKCIEAGMTDYLSKPVRLKVLENTIMGYLTKQQQQNSK